MSAAMVALHELRRLAHERRCGCGGALRRLDEAREVCLLCGAVHRDHR